MACKKRPKLRKVRAKERLVWALERKDWTAKDFQSTIWSDECMVERSVHARQIWVFHTSDKSGIRTMLLLPLREKEYL